MAFTNSTAQLGEAEALKYNLPVNRDATRIMEYGLRRGEASKLAKEKKADDLTKLYKDVKIDAGQYHRVLVPKVQERATRAWQEILDAQKSDPDNWKNTAADAVVRLNSDLMHYKALTNNYNQFQSKPVNEMTAPQRQANEVLRSGRFEDLGSLKDDNLGSFTIGQDGSLGQLWTVPRDKNHTLEAQNILTALVNKQPESIVEGERLRTGHRIVRKVKTADPMLADNELTAYWNANPGLKYQMLEANREKYKDLNLQTAQDIKALDEELYKDWYAKTSEGMLSSTSSSFLQYPAPKEGKEDKTQNVQPETGTVVTFTNPEVNPETGEQAYIDDQGKTVYADEKTAAAKGYTRATVQSNFTAEKAYNFNKEDLEITSEHDIDLSTGKQGKPSGARKYEINQVAKIPVVKHNDKWVLVTDKTAKEQPSVVKYKWYALGLEQAGTQKGQKINLPRAVPLTKGILQQLKDKKVNLENFEGIEESVSKGGEKATTTKKAESLRSKYGY